MACALWALGRHPELQDRAAAEVAALGNRPLTSDDVPRLGYIVEAKRGTPSVSAGGCNIPMVVQDFDVDGYHVAAGTMLVVGIYAMHRDPGSVGPPAGVNPDRFTPESSKDRDRWQYLPFGGGPRSCIGGDSAVLEATLGLAAVLRKRRNSIARQGLPLTTPFTMVAAAPIRVRVQPRN